MGSKGSQTATTTQNQTYAPAGAGYITNALDRAQNAANLPFNLPQQPVAGFSDLQNQAFGGYGGLANVSAPYTQTAANYFSPQGAQQFFNPFAANVMANLQDVFGQQQAQNTGNLVQAAGGVGADRIAVGQANLAKEQGLAAGQTLSNIYGQAQQQAQQAGQNTAALGFNSQNAMANALAAQLGAGGQQQQLAQAQLNAPYQYALQQAAFPYQQSNFLSGAVGALAPGLGGTSYGTGTSQSQYNPSLWGQIGGGLGALAGGLGYLGGFGGSGGASFMNPGSIFSSPSGGQISVGGPSGPTPFYAEGGAINPFADGGATDWMNADAALIPAGKIAHIAAQIPHLNLTPPAPSGSQGGQSGGGLGDILANGAKLAMMFASRGGSVNPFGGNFDDGGPIDQRFGDFTQPQDNGALSRSMQAHFGTPVRLAPEATAAWRAGNPLPAPPSGDDEPVIAADGGEDAAATPPQSAPTAGPPQLNPFAQATDQGPSWAGFLKSPWAALTAGGINLMAGRPFLEGAGAAIKAGMAQTEEERKQAADADKSMTDYQREMVNIAKQKADTAANKEKPLPSSLQKDLGEKAAAAMQLRALDSGFKPEFAGYGSQAVGDIANWAARQFNVGNTAAADWWQQYQSYQNKVRHELFGSALTATEAAQWDRQSVNPGMAPERIKANLQRQREIVEGALKRRASSLEKQGYSKEGIAAETGQGDEAAPSGPKIGETRTNKHGVTGKWNGHGWEIVQ